MKYSKQRELVQNIVFQNRIHPTANTVYNLLHEENPSLSLATVYRNLNLLSQMGVIQKISVPNASDHFDSTVEEHYHMICSSCNTMFDCPIIPLKELDNQIKSKSGFNVSSHQLIVYGICENCQAGN